MQHQGVAPDGGHHHSERPTVLVGVVDALGQHELGSAAGGELLELLLRGLPVGRSRQSGSPAKWVSTWGWIFCSAAADSADRSAVPVSTATVAGGRRLRQSQQRSAAADLDVVRVGADAEHVQGTVGES